MTAQPEPIPHDPDAATDASTRRSQRLLALSGVAFGVLFLIGSLTSSANTPDYTAADQAWTNWAHDNQNKSRISAFALLLAAFVFLYFIAGIRSVLESAEFRVRGSAQLVRVAFAGALTGVVGMSMAFVTIANASSEGANANPVVSRAVLTASAGPFLVAAMGFAAFLIAIGVLTLRSGGFARWTGIVALIGAVSFLTTSLTVINNKGNGSVFGYAFFPAILSLVTWTIATSVATYRAAST
jgi:succinate dehydrogenase/fumarate reductase cytochrome b subunit